MRHRLRQTAVTSATLRRVRSSPPDNVRRFLLACSMTCRLREGGTAAELPSVADAQRENVAVVQERITFSER